VRDVTGGQDLPEVIEWSKFSEAAWRKDSSGFYYERYAAPAPGEDYTGVNYYQKVYFHRLGDPQAQDILVYERPDQKEWGFSAEVSDDGRYLILHVWQGTDVRNRFFYQDLESGEPVVELIPELEAAYQFVGNDEGTFYLRTDLDAPRSRLIAIDTRHPAKTSWQTLIPQGEQTLESVRMVHDEFIALYLHDAHHRLQRFDRKAFSWRDRLARAGCDPDQRRFLNLTGERADDEHFMASGRSSIRSIYRYDFSVLRPAVFPRPWTLILAHSSPGKSSLPAGMGQVPMFLTIAAI
jgi:prolyl oligopeptidase